MKDIRGRVGFFHIYNLVDRAELLEAERNAKYNTDSSQFDGSKEQFDSLYAEIEMLKAKFK